MLIRDAARHTLALGEALASTGTSSVGTAWFEWHIAFWDTGACVLFAPEAWAALAVGIAWYEAGLIQDGADVTFLAVGITFTVWILRRLKVALDVFVLTVEVAVFKLTALRHIHWAVVGIEALWVTVTDVLLTWVAVFISAIFRDDRLTAVNIGVAFAADDLLFAGFTFGYTEESVKAIVTRVCPRCAFFWDRAWLAAWMAEWTLVVMANLVAFWALYTAVVEDADALFEVTELFFTAGIIGVAALSTFAVGKTDLAGLSTGTIWSTWLRLALFAFGYTAPLDGVTPVAFVTRTVRITDLETC